MCILAGVLGNVELLQPFQNPEIVCLFVTLNIESVHSHADQDQVVRARSGLHAMACLRRPSFEVSLTSLAPRLVLAPHTAPT